MDQRLQQAAESGSIDELYALIHENPYILEKIDAVPFVNTPFHVAAACGNIPFAMEVWNLKPSFARKLNTSGYSPLHVAVDNNQTDLVFWMLKHDHSLARIKGRNGITPFLFLVLKGDLEMVEKCLLFCPECIQDVTVNGQNALHLAVINDKFEVLKVITGWIQRMSQRDSDSTEYGVLNKQDYSYNRVLHLAAYKNDHQAIRLLLGCRWLTRDKANGDGLTFLDILRTQGQRDVRDLDSDLATTFTFWTYCKTVTRRLRSKVSEEDRGVFLIVCILMLTATYQTALQPPGGVHQSNDANAGSVVMKQTFFFLIWLANTAGFSSALFYTFCLLPVGNLFTLWFFYIGTFLCISYALAMAVISPHPLVFLSATFAFFLLFAFYLFWEFFLRGWHKYRR